MLLSGFIKFSKEKNTMPVRSCRLPKYSHLYSQRVNNSTEYKIKKNETVEGKLTTTTYNTENKKTFRSLKYIEGSLNDIDRSIKELTHSRAHSNYTSKNNSGLSDKKIRVIFYPSLFVFGALCLSLPYLPLISLLGLGAGAYLVGLSVIGVGIPLSGVTWFRASSLIGTGEVERAKQSYDDNYSINSELYDQDLDTFKRNVISHNLQKMNQNQTNKLTDKQMKENEDYLMKILNSKEDDDFFKGLGIEYCTIEMYNKYFDKQHEALTEELKASLEKQGALTKSAIPSLIKKK